MYLTSYGLIDHLMYYISKEDMIHQMLEMENELIFYKSILNMHNSCIFNLRIKTRRNKKVWIDIVRANREELDTLDIDEEISEALNPPKCER